MPGIAAASASREWEAEHFGACVVQIANALFERSGTFAEVRCDDALPIPGYSFVEQDMHGRLRPVVVLSPGLIPSGDRSVLAHVLAHEWGHHSLMHIRRREPGAPPETPPERQRKEDEADSFAAEFMRSRGDEYDLHAVEAFLRRNPFDLENRLQILHSSD